MLALGIRVRHKRFSGCTGYLVRRNESIDRAPQYQALEHRADGRKVFFWAGEDELERIGSVVLPVGGGMTFAERLVVAGASEPVPNDC